MLHSSVGRVRTISSKEGVRQACLVYLDDLAIGQLKVNDSRRLRGLTGGFFSLENCFLDVAEKLLFVVGCIGWPAASEVQRNSQFLLNIATELVGESLPAEIAAPVGLSQRIPVMHSGRLSHGSSTVQHQGR